MPRSYVSPLAARDAVLKQALVDHATRLAVARHLPAEDRRIARITSIITYRCECDAAQAVYDCAWAAIPRATLSFDKAAYERRHGTLDGPAFRSEDVETARAEMMAEVI